MDAHVVVHLAKRGRVQPSPRFHGFRHGLTIHAARRALTFTRRVERDGRLGPSGTVLHPKGWCARCQTPEGRRFRVDFDLSEVGGEPLILVVTAVEVER